MQLPTQTSQTVSQIVRDDYRTAEVFKRFGINYCCGGHVPLEQACAARNVDVEALTKELDRATRNISLPNNLQYNNWKVDFLIDYIVNVHHAYLRDSLPPMEANLLSFVDSHRKQHPELERVMEVFCELSALLLQACDQEEETLFPYIKQIDNTFRRRETYGSLFVKTLRKPLGTPGREQEQVSRLLAELRELTNQYTFSEKACTNHRVVFSKLREFDQDLVQHKHLENNVLLPRAVEMERQLLQQ